MGRRDGWKNKYESPAPLVAKVREDLRAVGISMTKTEHGEYRVAFKGRGNEASAYYTDNLVDALQTGLMMGREGKK